MSFPNDLGGYVRAEKKPPADYSQTPKERFNDLRGLFESAAAPKFEQKSKMDQQQFAFKFKHLPFHRKIHRRGVGPVISMVVGIAPTRSEARAALKKSHGWKTTRHLQAVR